MQEFDLEIYRANANAKLLSFFEYLYIKLGLKEDEVFLKGYFEIVNENDLIESLNYYIVKNHVTAQITANNYISSITIFYEELYEKYGITNEIFLNSEMKKRLLKRTKEIITSLRKTESKDVASDEQYETLRIGLKDTMSHFEYESIRRELTDYNNKSIKNTEQYYSLLSAITVNIVLEYAIKQISIARLLLSALNLGEKYIKINGYKLPLNDDMVRLFNLYLPIRSFILQTFSGNSEWLFVTAEGQSCLRPTKGGKGQINYDTFFKVVGDYTEGKKSLTPFANKRIIEMIRARVDISTISELTERPATTIAKLDDVSRELRQKEEALSIFLKEDKNNFKIKRKGYIDCPYCANSYEAVSENWLLVQFEKNGRLYLACKECKGKCRPQIFRRRFCRPYSA